ncbi:MAG: MarR family transcriptional regulator [Methanomassiliicoccales archaeon]|nr:MAG: MarR family transcriptional regulator [Methanomassiliicoccales archaeon]
MMNIEEAVRWVLSVDRRMLVMREAHENGVIKASELASRTGRSVQNISRAIHEMEREGLIECLTPEKETWKRYLLTPFGRSVLESMRSAYAFE